MKKVLLVLGSISIGFGLYMLCQGDTFVDQIALFVNGVILFGMAFIDAKEKSCHSKKE